jgi:predicted dehydrogenase
MAAGAALPAWYTAQAADVRRPRPVLSPNDRPALALIGCGGMGRGDAKNASRFCEVVAICDVDEARLDEAQKQHPDARRYRDFRQCLEHPGLHAVINGTPDHWHTIINLAAVRARLDVYSEKPLTLTIDEGRRLVKAVRAAGAVLQTGSQQRSDARFRLAVELVRNGRLGRLRHITTSLPSGRHGGPFATSEVPAGFDWNFWQGPTAVTPFVKERGHGSFRYWWDYSAGTLTDWGAHHNDIALWGLGLPVGEAGPVAIEGHALREPVAGGFSFPGTYFVNFRYANGVTHTCRTVQTEGGSGNVLDPKTPPAQMSNGVLFEGDAGWLFVSRGKIEASDPAILSDPLGNAAWRAYESADHMGNFFECLRSRKAPICDAEIGHRSVSLCHLGGIAIRLGRPLRWDPKAERFVGDREANGWVAREQRKGFGYDMIA